MFIKISRATADELPFCRTQADAALTSVEALDRYAKGHYVPKASANISPSYTSASSAVAGTAASHSEPDPLDMLASLPAVPATNPSPAPVSPSSGMRTSLSSKIASHLADVANSDRMTPEEVEVLRFTSRINGKVYLPFYQLDLAEDFRTASSLFTDPVCLRAILNVSH